MAASSEVVIGPIEEVLPIPAGRSSGASYIEFDENCVYMYVWSADCLDEPVAPGGKIQNSGCLLCG